MTATVTDLGLRKKMREQMPGFPPNIVQEIMDFLARGVTGDVQINVKSGRIINCRVSSYVYADRLLDDNNDSGNHVE